MKKHRAYLGVGSNLGDRAAYLCRAEDLLSRHPAVSILRSSKIYETPAVGGPVQGAFLNMVWEFDTNLDPFRLMDLLQRVEECTGRDRTLEVRWGPRTIDLDLLFYDDLVIESEKLIVPHPRLHERRFALEPLAELNGGLVHPRLGVTVETLLHRIPDSLFVT